VSSRVVLVREIPHRAPLYVAMPISTSDKPVYVNQAGLDRTGLTLMPVNGR
jgi:hypothetical protein